MVKILHRIASTALKRLLHVPKTSSSNSPRSVFFSSQTSPLSTNLFSKPPSCTISPSFKFSVYIVKLTHFLISAINRFYLMNRLTLYPLSSIARTLYPTGYKKTNLVKSRCTQLFPVQYYPSKYNCVDLPSLLVPLTAV